MSVDLVAFLLLAVLGVAGALAGVGYVVFTLIRRLLGSASRVTRRSRAVKPPRRRGWHHAAFVCPQDGCRHVEHRKALFCSQCGAKMMNGAKAEKMPLATPRGCP